MGDEEPVSTQEWRSGEYVICDDPARLDFGATCGLLWSTYWAAVRSEEVIRESIRHSLCFGLFHGEKQIGFARVVTDFCTVAYLCDVIIAEEYRGAGLGKWLVSTILAHPSLTKYAFPKLFGNSFRSWPVRPEIIASASGPVGLQVRPAMKSSVPS